MMAGYNSYINQFSSADRLHAEAKQQIREMHKLSASPKDAKQPSKVLQALRGLFGAAEKRA